MKRKIFMLGIMLSVLLTGCADTVADDVLNTEEMETEQEMPQTGNNSMESTETVKEDAEKMTQENKETSRGMAAAVVKVTVENPSYSYYNDGSVDADAAATTLILTEIRKESNGITNEEDWFADNGLEKPMSVYSDEEYRYEISGDSNVLLYNPDGELLADLDFSQYRMAEEYKPEYVDYINQRVNYAKAKDGILYVATAHLTYASSCPQTAYITAVDLSDYHVVWKSEPLTCNSDTFEIIGNSIVCGYGFTDEDDYLKLVDSRTGVVTEEIPVKSKPDYIIKKGNNLYVKTYDTDYIFEIQEK